MSEMDAGAGLAAFTDRFVEALSGAFFVYSVYIGDRLGYYGALGDRGPSSSQDLAAAVGADERMTREWLEQQAVAGVLAVDDENASPSQRRYSLPAGVDVALTDAESLDYLPPFAQLFVGAASPTEALLDAYRTGTGVPYAAYGADLVEGQGRANRNLCLQVLGQEWLPAIADVHERLSEPGSAIADIGCGVAWSTIGMAQAYPNATVTGFDLDEASFRAAKANIDASGLGDRVDVKLRDVGHLDFIDHFDLVFALECLHDMADPVGALSAMRHAVRPGGAVLVVDERVRHTFSAGGDDLEWMMYGWSILHCLPVGMADHPTEATGTVMRPSTVDDYARRAGFAAAEILSIDNDFFCVYRLHQND